MKGVTFSILAAGCTASSSLCQRKNSAFSTMSMSGFLSTYYLTSLVLSFLIALDIWSEPFSLTMFMIGALVGICNIFLMQLTDKALKHGPASLTFAFLNASSVFPGIILFSVFGRDWGFTFSFLQLIGMGLVILGLYLGAQTSSTEANARSYRWLIYALGVFAVQVMALTLIQVRCLLFECNSGITSTQDVWFMPGLFGTGFLVQIMLFLRGDRKIEKPATLYGSLAGVANFGSTCLLMLATKHALPFEKGVLFPLFAVTAILFCSLWAKWLYSEKFNLKANLACILGVFIGSF